MLFNTKIEEDLRLNCWFSKIKNEKGYVMYNCIIMVIIKFITVIVIN
ncbi:hypothetical protein FHS11_001368 [Mucilaginibacter gotjawali]|uniref:Uncharacterized protein n=1 Tax=Mucilaginibacter gotjawali TaxID=1550579 RepID=A0A839S9Y3_9SPHI|nr:hypothetical protein [Mucilaginibacter gotjawali]